MNIQTEKGNMMKDRKPDAHTRVSRKELLDEVSFARKFKSGGFAVLENVKLAIREDGDVTVRATDLETDVVSRIQNDVFHGENPIELLIDKKKLAETLKSLGDESVTLEFFAGEDIPNLCPECGTAEFDAPPAEETEEVLTPSPVLTENSVLPEANVKPANWDEKTCAKCGYVGKSVNFYPPNIQAEFKVGKFFTLHPGLNVDEFPNAGDFPEELEDVVVTTVGALRKVVGATTKKESGFKLSVVSFNAEDGLMVATDGHRLHSVKAGIEQDLPISGDTIEKIIAGKKEDDGLIFSLPPAEPAIETDGLKKAELIAMWEKHNGEKLPTSMTVADIKAKFETITHKQKKAYMRDGNREITMLVPEINFPDYKAVTNFSDDLQEISVNTGVLREGMKQALALTNTKQMAVKMSFNDCIDLETVVEGDSYNRTSVAIVSGGVEPQVSNNYNARYISDILGLFKDDVDLTLSVPEGSKPLFFNDNAGFEGLVMPTRSEQ